MGVLCCFALFVCLTLLLSFFLLISYLKTCIYQILTSIISVSITCSDDWSDQTHKVPVAEFVEPVGPTSVVLPPTVLGIFKLFFTTTLVATIVEQTNVYARQVLGDAAEGKWTDVTDADIWAFLGFALLMGINRLPQTHLYWNKDPVFHYLPIAEWIPRDRFMAIWRFMYFTDNTAQPQSSASSASAPLPDSTRPVDRSGQ